MPETKDRDETEEMKTDDLITLLASDPAPAPAASLGLRAGIGLLAGLAVTLVLFFWLLGPRYALFRAESDPVVAAKPVLPLVLGLLAVVLTLRSVRPGAPLGRTRRAIWLVPAAGAALFLWSFVTTPEQARLRDFLGHSIPVCLPFIVVLSVPLYAGFLAALRSGAATRPVLSGALAGLAAAGIATTVYSMFCNEDSPLFYATWYSAGILIATGLGAAAGARLLRW